MAENVFGGHFDGHDVTGVNIGTVFNYPANNQADEQCLRDLLSTDPRHDKKRILDSKGDLLRDSFLWILDEPTFRQWHDDDDIRLLWIRGDPGKGKTMLMMGLIEELSNKLQHQSESCIISFFFCQSTDSRLNNAVSVLRGLIYIIVHEHRQLLQHVRKRYDTTGRLLFEDANAFYALSDILFDILRDPSLGKVYLLIDALDECDSDLPQLLNLVTRTTFEPSCRVKWLVSSRNQPKIESRLKLERLSSALTLELNTQSSSAVDFFIDFQVGKLASMNQYTRDLEMKVREYLRSNAGGTFLWVSLVCHELARVSRRRTLSVLHNFPPGLQALYDQMLERIWAVDPEDTEACRRIISSVVLAYRPLHLKELVFVAGLEEDSDDIYLLKELVDLCGPFLTVREETIYFIHQTARDYLYNERARLSVFPLGVKEEHSKIVQRLLRVMSAVLKRDICDIREPGAALDELSSVNLDLPARIRYACCYWVRHLGHINDISWTLEDGDRVQTFLQNHFLHWLEALGLLGRMSDGVLMVAELDSMIKMKNSINPGLQALVHDARRFILRHRSLIERMPLQLYDSALLSSPRTSVIRRIFSGEGQVLTESSAVGEVWGPWLQTLEGHSDGVTAVTFSPDARLLASSSYDKTVKLWDAVTGILLQTLEGHSDWVIAVTFSPDARLLASSSLDMTVRLWDPETGAALRTFEGHIDWVSTVTFSPDTRLLASSSRDKTVKLWDVVTGILLQTLEGHSDWVTAVTFSPDARLLASPSYDKTVKLWDAVTGILLQTLEGHSDWVTAVTFSPDGQLVASSSLDMTVRLWDAATGAALQTLMGHSDSVMEVKFSPDGQLLASSSADSAVMLWDANTGALRQTLEGH